MQQNQLVLPKNRRREASDVFEAQLRRDAHRVEVSRNDARARTVKYEVPTAGFLLKSTPTDGGAPQKSKKFAVDGHTFARPLANALYHIPVGTLTPSLFRALASEQPKNVAEEGRLRSGVSLHSRSHAGPMQPAWTWAHSNLSAWSPVKDDCDDDWLEVDLGEECMVTAVSTCGRRPSTTMWPPSGWGGGGVTEFEGSVQRAWPREWQRYVVVATDRRGLSKPQEWVRRYELLCRQRRGCKWMTLGKFEGNDDSTSEVAHSLRNFGPRGEGLRLRYVRFRPLSRAEGGFHVRKALRVCVFGERMDGSGAVTSVVDVLARRRRRVPVAHSDAADELSATVTYGVRRPAQRGKDGEEDDCKLSVRCDPCDVFRAL